MNPHEKILIDETSGCPYENQRYLDYEQGAREKGERINRLVDELMHYHHGEFCFSPKKFSELRRALKEEGDGS